MKKISWITIIISVILSGVVAYLVIKNTYTIKQAPVKESVYDRVMRTGTIRCGYVIAPPFLIKDPKTGKLSGIFYDYIEEIGKNADLNIDWAEESGWATISEDLNNRRFDVFCNSLWKSATRAKYIDFINPIFYSTDEAFVRKGDTRFLNNMDKVNNEDVTIATIDGEMSDEIAKDKYPNAKKLSHINMSPNETVLIDLINNKADITFQSREVGLDFMKKNEGKIDILNNKNPEKVFANNMAIKKGEYDLKNFLDDVTEGLLYDGTIDRIISKYEDRRGLFTRISLPIER